MHERCKFGENATSTSPDIVLTMFIVQTYMDSAPSVLWCCWLGLLTCKTHYRVGEPTAAWQFVDICQHRSFDNGWQYVSCGQRQPPLSGAPVNKWLSAITRERQIPPDSESGGIPHLFGTFLSPHIGSDWRARHDNNNNNIHGHTDARTDGQQKHNLSSHSK